YYFAYWVGLALSGFTFWATGKIWPPPIMEDRWVEPRDYVRPEEEGEHQVIEAVSAAEDVAANEKGPDEKIAMKVQCGQLV
ncbi:hypothetical protein, partial [Salmonella enterica]|uniref:hypothetical protein n=1 Tax=Salmonella enterica TaxID=28901 RepID=UPI0020C22E90